LQFRSKVVCLIPHLAGIDILYLGEHGPVTKREPQVQQPFRSRTYRGEQVIWNLEQETFRSSIYRGEQVIWNLEQETFRSSIYRGEQVIWNLEQEIFRSRTYCKEQVIWNLEQETYIKHIPRGTGHLEPGTGNIYKAHTAGNRSS
jgi:hypothetical protein